MPARTIFLDANGWVALLNNRERSHAEANRKWLECGQSGVSVILTDWVVAETGNGLARTSARAEFVESLRRFSANPRFRIISVSKEIRERALDLYAARPDKAWGLVDCASFIVMADEGITKAFTTDKHFEQAGFERLLPAEAA